MEAFHGGENHGYLTFRAHAQALAACAVVSAALGTIAPPPGPLPAAVHCVSHSVVWDLTVHTRHDALGEGQQDTLPAGDAPPRADRPSLMEANVRRLIADAVSRPPQVLRTQPQVPSRGPTTNAIDDAGRPLPQGPPPPARPTAQQAPPSREKGPVRPEGGAAAP